MKKKKKYQNQLISLNQNIHIKYYLNFLTFFFISSFRLKYYYNYINYYKLFRVFSKVLGFSIRSHYLLKAIMLPNFFYFKLFRNYGSYNLNKFTVNKNVYLDSSTQYFYNKKNVIQKYTNKNITLDGRNFIIVNDSTLASKNNLFMLYNNMLLKGDDTMLIYNYFIYLEFLSILSSLIIINQLYLYKLYITLIFKNI